MSGKVCAPEYFSSFCPICKGLWERDSAEHTLFLLSFFPIQINGALASPPETPLPGVTVSLIGRYVQITTNLGVQLQFNGDHELFVRVTEKYKGRLCGLCGTYTGTQQDDFTRPDGVVAADVNEFGTSWSVPDDEWP